MKEKIKELQLHRKIVISEIRTFQTNCRQAGVNYYCNTSNSGRIRGWQKGITYRDPEDDPMYVYTYFKTYRARCYMLGDSIVPMWGGNPGSDNVNRWVTIWLPDGEWFGEVSWSTDNPSTVDRYLGGSSWYMGINCWKDDTVGCVDGYCTMLAKDANGTGTLYFNKDPLKSWNDQIKATFEKYGGLDKIDREIRILENTINNYYKR